MKKLLTVIGLVVVFAMAQSAAWGQWKKDKKEDATTRSVQGAVFDESEKPVQGAAVHLKNTKTLQIRSFITKEDGTYSFHGLSTNIDYELKAEAGGASSDTKTLSVFDSRSKAIINLKLENKKS